MERLFRVPRFHALVRIGIRLESTKRHFAKRYRYRFLSSWFIYNMYMKYFHNKSHLFSHFPLHISIYIYIYFVFAFYFFASRYIKKYIMCKKTLAFVTTYIGECVLGNVFEHSAPLFAC